MLAVSSSTAGTLHRFNRCDECCRRLVFSATQKARGDKKTAGALEDPGFVYPPITKGRSERASLPPLLYLCAMGSRTRRRTREKKQYASTAPAIIKGTWKR